MITLISSAGEEIKEASRPEASEEKQQEEIVVIAPKFTRLLADVLAADGDTVKFECAVEGKPKPSIRWCQNNKDIVESDRIKVSYSDHSLWNVTYVIFCSLLTLAFSDG